MKRQRGGRIETRSDLVLLRVDLTVHWHCGATRASLSARRTRLEEAHARAAGPH
jgi:hypothetical protein